MAHRQAIKIQRRMRVHLAKKKVQQMRTARAHKRLISVADMYFNMTLKAQLEELRHDMNSKACII